MAAQRVKIAFTHPAADYDIRIGSGLLNGAGRWAKASLGPETQRILIVSNSTVFKLYGSLVSTALTEAGFSVSTFLMKDGEQFKTLKTAEAVMQAMSKSDITRTDAVAALGGGVVGDLAGFAAAIYLRGISFLQIPTTLLAMVDSSVGGKTGVNASVGKNRIGAFHQPRGVLIDTDVLKTLPGRELTAGLCEMIKHGAIGGRKLLAATADAMADTSRPRFAGLIAENVKFKASIVAGDERESSKRTDGKSRKILNFGHTLAHALEKVTNYRYFKHGEAVGYGILFAAQLSKELALLPQKDINSLNDVVHQAGTLPSLDGIDGKEVFEAFKFDKKHLSGSLQMVLLKGIGKPVIVSERDIPRSTIQRVLKMLLK